MTSFKIVVKAFNELEKTSATLEKIEILKELFKKVNVNEIDKLIYLTQGILYPNFVDEPPIGIAEKIAVKAISKMSGLKESEIKKLIDEKGEIGDAIITIMKRKKKIKTLDTFFGKDESNKKDKDLSINEIYTKLYEIAHLVGKGSTLKKIDLVAELLSQLTEEEAKYILRIILGKLRLGIADMTIINALSVAFTGNKENKILIEKKYNIYPDLGKIGKILAEKGLKGLDEISISVGTPIKMMLAQRAKSIDEIFERMGSSFACEYKYDGERVQAHKLNGEIILFSRNIENISDMYPDIRDAIKRIKSNKLILEGEIVAVDPITSKFKPFQELMRRRRKYKIEEIMKDYPVELYLFDILLIEDKNLLETPYLKRREILENLIKSSNLEDDPVIKLANQKIVNSKEDLLQFFEDAIDECEGLMIKSIRDESIYQAGNRGYLWLKLKRSYHSKMIDSVDVVIIGAYMGRGRRGGTYGALLCAVYNKDLDIFQSICKLGSGFKDEDMANFSNIFKDLELNEKPSNVDEVVEKLKPDVWIEPKVVCSIIGDEISLSPDHRAGYNLKKEGAGFAIRFPRFLGWRFDKSVEDITTVDEILDMYEKQSK